MVVYTLYIKANLDGVTSLSLKENADICISVRHPTDTEYVRERIVVERETLLEPGPPASKHQHVAHAEPACHFAMKWDHDRSERSTIRVLDPAKSSKKYPTIQDAVTSSGSFVPILALECDNIEPFAFHCLGDEFKATTKSNETVDVDLSSGRWESYDIATGTFSLANLQFKFE